MKHVFTLRDLTLTGTIFEMALHTNAPRCKILVVDDNFADRLIIQEILLRADVNAEIYFAENGEQAVEFLDRADRFPDAPFPDLVLLDLNLPKVSGHQVLQHMRDTETCSSTRVLVITSSDNPRDRAVVNSLGADKIFIKPVSLHQYMRLGNLVKKLLPN